ncbi:glycosyltransferase family 28 protein [Spatholobus suberectus]|nr:glycosyltransferase family 28 protein [Spatholobus suberectus]
MKTRGKEEQEASKGNQTMIMNSPTMKGEEDEKEEEAMSMWDCGSPLYDSYELVSLDHIIDQHLMAFPSSHGLSKPTITRFTHHDMGAHKVAPPEKSKGSFMVTSLSKFSVKIIRKKRKNNEERGKKNKEMRRGFAGFVVDLLYLWRK